MSAGLEALSRAGGAFPLHKYVHPAREHLGRRCKQAGEMYVPLNVHDGTKSCGVNAPIPNRALGSFSRSTDGRINDPHYIELEDSLVQFIVMRFMGSKYDVVSPRLAALRGRLSSDKVNVACQTVSDENDATDCMDVSEVDPAPKADGLMSPKVPTIDALLRCLSSNDAAQQARCNSTNIDAYSAGGAASDASKSATYYTVAQSETYAHPPAGIAGLDSSMWV